MTSQLTVNELLERNKAVAAKHEPIPTFAELSEMGAEPGHIVILTCADPRCNPRYYFDLKPNDGVIIFRDVNGHVAPVLKDLLALDTWIGIHDIMIVHHTDCGALQWTDEQVRTILKQRNPEHSKEIDGIPTFGAVTNIEQSIKDDLAFLKSSPFIRKELADRSVGYVFDIKTGKLSPVEG
ncbi:carbonic anhydrase [Acephala macrosclerotiorum]|nr:carbonic anhydrase [Acephala macrosclerotiorum]